MLRKNDYFVRANFNIYNLNGDILFKVAGFNGNFDIGKKIQSYIDFINAIFYSVI